MNKKLLMTMCGLLTIGSISVGSFADKTESIPAVALQNSSAVTAESIPAMELQKALTGADLSVPAVVLESSTTVKESVPATDLISAVKISDASVVTGSTNIINKSFDLEDCVYTDGYDLTWAAFKEGLGADIELSDEDNVKLEALFNEIIAAEEKLYEEDKDFTDEDFKDIDTKWDEFYSILDTYYEADDYVISWTDLKTELGTDIEFSKEDDVKLETLFSAIAVEEEKLCNTEKELTNADFESLDKKWDDFFVIVDKYFEFDDEDTENWEDINADYEMSMLDIEEATPLNWEEIRAELETDSEISKEDDVKLEVLLNSIVSEEERLYESDKELTDADIESLDNKWEEFFTIVDKYYDESDVYTGEFENEE